MFRRAFLVVVAASAVGAHAQSVTTAFTRDLAVSVSSPLVALLPNGQYCVAAQSGNAIKVYVVDRINAVKGFVSLPGPSPEAPFSLGALTAGPDSSIYVSTRFGSDVKVWRLNSSAGILWSKTVNGGSTDPEGDIPTASTIDPMGNLIVVGIVERGTNKPGGFCFGLRPTNAGLFTRNQTEASAEAVAVHTDGTIFVGCSGENTGRLWKLSSAGATTLLAPLGTNERAYGIAVSADGTPFIAGDVLSGVQRVAYMAKLNPSNGAMVWGFLNGDDGSRYETIAFDGSGNVYGAGFLRDGAVSGSSVLKVDPVSGGSYYHRTRLGSGGNPFASFGSFFLDAYSDHYLVTDQDNGLATDIVKNAVTGGLRWAHVPPAEIEYDSRAVFHNASGDIFMACVTDSGNLRWRIFRQAPLAVTDAFSTPRNTPLAGRNVKTNDRFALDASPTLLTTPTNGSAVVNPNGTFTYTPNAAFTGSDSFTYRLTRGTGLNSATGTVNITVTP